MERTTSENDKCVHGSCVGTANSYICMCSEGYTGMYCDKKNESSIICRNLKCFHGQCRFSENGEPYCECAPNFTGEYCDKGYFHMKENN
ncbi:unnamed protein product [Ranitomeya imitator]|uniref:EGF-like domain-containing protein n=1 Tax=Ranitomeya imitator TaxID=111125 RepID=A0ABN9LB49_9NEOB|nr:unnamed protein product [Ranitomeya imitator]